MSQLRVCIYGGTDLQRTPTQFIADIAHAILTSMPAVIVTGGFRHSRRNPDAISTDVAALKGARAYAADKGTDDVRKYFEAWIPEPVLDGRRAEEDVVRMTESDGVALRVMTGRTALGRRLAMVAGVDMVVTISGKQHTEVVVEQALELGRPVLPIPVAGGDSRDLLEKYRKRIAAAFEPNVFERCLRDVSANYERQPMAAAKSVVELLQTAKVGRCLVLLPFDDEHNDLYRTEIEPAIVRHMIPLRLDRLPRSDAIYTSFADAVRSSTSVIADITRINENVMYEIGYAHGCGLSPLIYTRDPTRLDRLPVYFRTLNVRLAPGATGVGNLVDEYLRSYKASRSGDRLLA